MVFGSFVVAFCLIVLGWTAEIVAMFVKDPEKVGAASLQVMIHNFGYETNQRIE